MSYYAHSRESTIRISKENQQAILDMYNVQYDESVGPAKDIYDVFENTGFVLEPCGGRNSDGSVCLWFEYNPYHSDDVENLLGMIAPYVDAGSYITFVSDEDDSSWAFYFDGTKATEYNGETVYPGMPGEVLARNLNEHDSIMANLETIFGTELAHDLPQSFIDRINDADRGSVLQAIAEALFDAVMNRPLNAAPIPSNVLMQLVTGDDAF